MKRLLIVGAVMLLLAACNTSEDAASKEEKQIENKQDLTEEQEKGEKEEADSEANSEQEEVETEEYSEAEKDNPTDSNTSVNDQAEDDGKNEQKEKTPETVLEKKETNSKKDKEEKQEDGSNHQELIDLAYAILDAQDKKDYTYLQSVLSSGSSLNKKKNEFSFEEVTYPHTQEFLTEKDIGELEIRYTHEENDLVIVGFGAINYETESSFVIDFQFVKEDSAWKMKDMDINK